MIVSAIIIIILKAKKVWHHSPYNFLFTALSIYMIICLFNFLENSSITQFFNIFENYLFSLFFLFFGFFVYSFYLKKELSAIIENNSLFKTLVEDIPGIVYISNVDKDFSSEYVSPQVYNVFGKHPEEFYKNSTLWDNNIIDEDKEKLDKMYKNIKALKNKKTIEYKITLRDNKIHWFKDNVRFLTIDNKDYLLGVSIDITDLKTKEQELNKLNIELEKKLSAISRLNKLSKKLQEAKSPFEIMKKSTEIMKGYLGNPYISLFKISDDNSALELVYHFGFEKVKYDIGKTILIKNFLNGKPLQNKKVIISNIDNDERIEKNIKKELINEGFKSIISIPLLTKKTTLGVMNLMYKIKISLEPIDISTLESIGKTIGLALENSYYLEKIIESEEKYRTLAETAKDIILIHDLSGNIRYVNKVALDLSGYKINDTRNMKLQDIFPLDEKDKFFKKIEKRLSGDTSTFLYNTKFYDKNGEKREIEVISTPIIKKGKIDSILSISRDITERLAKEEEIRTLSYVIEQTTSSIIITDLKGNIEYVNPIFEKITGYSFEEIKGKNPKILKSGKHNKRYYKELWETIKKGKVWNRVIINRKKDGTFYYEDAVIFPIKDKNGEIRHYAAVKKDITREKLFENQTRQMQRLDAIGNLTAGIAHDFNNILTSILGYTEMLKKELVSNKKALKKLNVINNVGYKAKDLVSKLLGYSRKQIIKPKSVNINITILELKDVLKRVISEDIELIFNLNDNIPNIYADKNQIEQILLNLVINGKDAIKGLKPNKEIKEIIIETDEVIVDEKYVKTHLGSSKGRFIMLKVTDNGMGMDNKTIEKIFEPFFTTKDKGKGTGLGLSTVYGIVKQNKGFIYAYSEVGIGTTIKVYWPVLKDSNPIENPEIIENKIEENNNEQNYDGTALVVEDDKEVREIAKEFLSSFGFNVLEASNGIEGLNHMKKNKSINLILSDVVMPKMDGIEFYNKIIKIRKDIKFIFTSGYPLTHPEISKKINGDVSFLQKPYTLNDISKTLKNLFK
jgi:PAS domain S-box-containing protein